ncbi:MAG: hypothetical protein LUC17_02790 [Oscillospiraceae bacterium]|nr:hypothetical protein [Oscillospiraceae bacterium]
MNIGEWIAGETGVLILILSLIQIAPVKVNPWSRIARGLGKALTVEVVEKLEEAAVNEARYRIIRFDDEIRHKMRHTEEHFNQIMDDIQEYERYCKKHPDYPNRKAQSAIKNIDEVYRTCRNEGKFLV